MKKLFFSVAVLAAFASCSKNEVTDVAPSNLGSEIGFTTLNDRITKSATDNSDNYQVYSLQSTEAESAWYIDEEVSDADAILSGRKYYWPVDGSKLAFYAYAPADVTATAEVKSGPEASISIDYVVPAKADEDFTVAKALDFGAETENTVDLTFSHKLSKVTIAVELSEALTQAGYYVDTTLSPYSATLDVEYDSQTMDVVTGLWSTETGAQTTSNDYAAYSGTTSYMILPQSAPTSTITITDLILYAKVVDEETSMTTVEQVLGSTQTPITLSPYEITGIDMTAFVEGTHYIITIIIDGSTDDDEEEDLLDPIAFYSDLVDWTEATATVYATDVNVKTDVISINEEVSYEDVITYDYTSGFEIYSVATNGTENLLVDDPENDNDAYSVITGYDKTLTDAAEVVGAEYTCRNEGTTDATVTISQVVTTTTYSVSNDKYLVKVYTVEIVDSSDPVVEN